MADSKISALTALAALPATNDYFVILDTSASTTKKLAANYIYHDWASHTPRYRDWETDRKSTRLNSSHSAKSRMPSSA